MKFSRHFAAAAVLLMAAAQARPMDRDIYPDPSVARDQIAAALKTAAQTHRRVLLDFGGNWCGDCIVLDMYLHNGENRGILEANFVLVHVNVGHLDTNLDIAERYGAVVTRGVPIMAVLSETGKVLYSDRNKELEMAAQRSDPSGVTRFLVQWRPAKAGCSVMVVNC